VRGIKGAENLALSHAVLVILLCLLAVCCALATVSGRACVCVCVCACVRVYVFMFTSVFAFVYCSPSDCQLIEELNFDDPDARHWLPIVSWYKT
jgi:hypothetical protein